MAVLPEISDGESEVVLADVVIDVMQLVGEVELVDVDMAATALPLPLLLPLPCIVVSRLAYLRRQNLELSALTVRFWHRVHCGDIWLSIEPALPDRHLDVLNGHDDPGQ